MIKQPHDEMSEWAHVYELYDYASVSPSTRPPPPSAAAFDAPDGEMCHLPFEFDGEREIAAARLREAVGDALVGIKELDYSRHDWGDDEAEIMAKVLSTACPDLERLHMSGNDQISRLPDAISTHAELRTLFLHGCSGLIELPHALGACTKLRTLYLTGCVRLVRLPESLCDMPSLRELDLTRCTSLVALPERLAECRNLNSLMLSGCSSLEWIPERLPPLNGLYATGCTSLRELPERLTTAPPQMILSPRKRQDEFASAEALEAMDMTLKLNMCESSSLRDLFLRGCASITHLPESFDALTSLRHLDLSYCSALTALPEAFGTLPALKKANFSMCSSLAAIPPLHGLLSLEDLDLSRCTSLLALPDGLEELSGLTVLTLEGCSLLPLHVRMSRTLPPVKMLQRIHDAAEAAGLAPDPSSKNRAGGRRPSLSGRGR